MGGRVVLIRLWCENQETRTALAMLLYDGAMTRKMASHAALKP